MNSIIFLFIIFFILLILNFPISIALGLSAIFTIFYTNFNSIIIAQNFYASITSFPLLAIPFFILAGVIMKNAKIAKKIADFFSLIIGGVTGGLAIVAVMTSMFWGSLSGSGPATTAAVGFILIDEMRKNGYDKYFSAAIIAASSDLSIIIPPSIAFIIFGNLTSTSISKLFIAGIIPGIIMGLFLLITAYILSKKNNYKGIKQDLTAKKILSSFKDSFFALLSPVIILGGIYTGIFTPTEAAVAAVFYSLFIAVFIYKSFNFENLISSLIEASIISSVIMLLVAFASLFSYIASIIGVVDLFYNWILNFSQNKIVLILLINLIILLLGMILDAISIMYIIVPMIFPIIQKLNINPIYFGVIFICALAIGQATPPVGVNLFTALALIEDGKISKLSIKTLPFIFAAIIALILITIWGRFLFF